MDAHQRTRITLANVKYDLGRKHRLPLWRLLRVLRAALKRDFWKPDTGSHEEAESAFESVLDSAPSSMFCNGPAVKRRRSLSLITDDSAFHLHYVRLSSRATVVDRKTRLPRFVPLSDTEVRSGAMLRTTRAFAWVTDSDALQSQIVRAGGTTAAKRVRDFLGLVFKTPRQHLIELGYPADVAQTVALAAPTVLEGACVTVFRCVDGDDGWGAAVDLEALQSGAVEAVHRPIPFTSAFVYRDLGPVGDRRVLSEDDLTPLFSPWTPEDSKRVDSLSKRPRRRGKKS